MSARFIAFIVIALLLIIVFISGSDISGLSLNNLWFFLRVVIGIAIMIAATVVGYYGFVIFGRNLITGAVTGLVVGTVLYAIGQIIWRALFSTP